MVHWGTHACSTATASGTARCRAPPSPCAAGEPVDLSAYRGRDRRRRAAARGHRPDHGPGPRPARRGPRRGRPAGVLPAGDGVTIEIQRVAVLGAGSWGTTFAKVLADAGRDVVLWARRAEVAAAITERPLQPRLPARRRAARRWRRRPPPAAALEGADAVVLAVPSQTLRRQPHRLAAAAPAGRDAGQPDEGRRAGHAGADERGDRRGRRTCRRTGSRCCPARTWPARSPPSSRPPPWSPAPTTTAPSPLQHACMTGYFRAVHQQRRDRLRARRRGEERDRAGRRDGRRAWGSATTAGPR